MPQELQCNTDSQLCATCYKLRCLQTPWKPPLQLLHHQHGSTKP